MFISTLGRCAPSVFILRRAIFCLFALSLCATTNAQDFPTKPIRVIVAFAAGGTVDNMARMYASELAKSLGQPVVVENRPGANGVLGTQELAKSPPDGHTLMFTLSSLVTNAILYPTQSYDTLKDIAPVSLVATSPLVLVVHPTFPATTVPAFSALAKSKPGELFYATPGAGSTQHLFNQLLDIELGVKTTHVPYKGGGAMIVDVVAGRVPIAFMTPIFAQAYLKDGRLKAVAVTSRKRLSTLPDVPTISETVPGFEADLWFGIVAPGGTPKPLVAKLSAEIARITNSQAMKDQLFAQVAEPVGSTPEQFAQVIDTEYKRWSTLIKQSGIKADQ